MCGAGGDGLGRHAPGRLCRHSRRRGGDPDSNGGGEDGVGREPRAEGRLVWGGEPWPPQGELAGWIRDIEARRACEREVPDVPTEVVRRFLDGGGEQAQAEVIAAAAAAPGAGLARRRALRRASRMVVALMRSQTDAPEWLVADTERCIAEAGRPHHE